MTNRFVIALTALVGACGFSADLPPDAPGPNITIGFEQSASNADEKSGSHLVTVKLSEMSATDVTVKYQISDTTASPTDFDVLTPETITVPAGQMSTTLNVQVKADQVDPEPNETIDFVLLDPVGAQIAFGAEKHRVTILAKALPRVSFMAATSMTQEPMDESMTVVLDEASEFAITVDYTVTSTDATSGMDYMLANGTLMFAPNETTKPIVLDVLDDQLDEENENVVVTLANPTGSFLGSTVAHTHTILDTLVDPPPTVQFSAPTSTFAENGAAQTITVTLSALSGRVITVPYSIDNANSNAGAADITVTGTSLTIPAGQMTGTIAVTILQDMIDEPTETVEIDLGATPTNATLGAQTNHRLSITDDDLVCYGPPNSGADVCFQDVPTGTVNVGSTIDTNVGSASCSAATIDFGPGQDAACFVVGATVNINNATTVTGSRPLVIVATTALNINNLLDASSKASGAQGPGSGIAPCANGTNPGADGNGAGGGAGGSFMGRGANGGAGGGANGTAGVSATADATPPTKLRGGCPGQKGGNGGGGQGGRGGGAVYLLSGGTMAFGGAGIINVSGAGGEGGNTNDGGGGGGSAGMIQLYAVGNLTVVNNQTKFVANGGGGGSGGTNSNAGATGSDPSPQNPDTQALGGRGSGVNGGDGFAGGSAPTVGDTGGSNDGGGGGGGGGGFILSNKSLGNAEVSASTVMIVQ